MYSRFKHGINIAAYLIGTIAVVQQPLFGSFGFEFSASIALLASCIAGLNSVHDARKKSDVPPPARLRYGLGYNLLYVLLPVVAIFLAALPGLPCDPFQGLAFYGLLPVVSVVFSYLLGWLLSLSFKHARILFIAIVILSLAVPALFTFIQPRIFFYNAFLGFFPGLSYDQLMPVTQTLVLYRSYILFLSLLIIVLLYILKFEYIGGLKMRERMRAFSSAYSGSLLSVVATVGLIVIAVQFLSRGTLGFSTSRAKLESELGSVFRSPHMEIHYASESFSDSSIAWVVLEHEFRRHQAAGRLGVLHTGVIRSYLYPSPESKRALIGPATTNIAKPWRREVHLNADRYESSLLHELAHVVAAEFGMPILGIANSTLMLEGVAMAAEGVWGNRTLHEHAAAMIEFGIVESPAEILTNRGFVMKSSAVSYILAGSYMQYLMDRYGVQPVQEAYAWSDFEGAFGRPAGQLIREWIDFLRRIQVSDRQEAKTRIHFQRTSLFTAECPRAVARMNRKGREYLAKREFESAREEFNRSFRTVPNAAAIEGIVISAFRLGDYETVMDFMNDEELHRQFPQIIPALLRVSGNMHIGRGEYDLAGVRFRGLLELDLSEWNNEYAMIRLSALSDPDDRLLLDFLAAPPDDERRILAESLRLRENVIVSPASDWALAFSFIEAGNREAALRHYEKLLSEPDDFIRYRFSLVRGEDLFYRGRFQDAAAEFWTALNYASNPATIHELQTRINRALFADEFGMLIWSESPPWKH